VFSVNAQERDMPLEGEGIYAFLRRHNRPDNQENYQAFLELNKDKLDKEPALLLGFYYYLPPAADEISKKPEKTAQPNTPDNGDSVDAIIAEKPKEIKKPEPPQPVQPKKKLKTARQPLFGKKYAEYTIVDQELAGACFFLSSGHGGPDCGAIARVNGRELHEDEYAYDITLRLARNLLQHGATVHIIIQDAQDGIRDSEYLNNSRRETCMGRTIPFNQMARLQQRTNTINRLSAKAKGKYQRAVFIHLDSRSKKKQLDVFFYYQNQPSNRNRSRRLAETMRRTFADRYAVVQPGRGFSGSVSTRSLTVMNYAKPVSIFIELANMQNEFDQRRYLSDDNRQALANWMTLGFIRDYHNSKAK
jgi:N-acetylmuramoyl-L-alanine amidase